MCGRSHTLLLLLLLFGCTTPKPDSGADSPPDSNDTPPADQDGDGFAEPADCDDNDGSVYPGATEICNEVDDDCDALVDDEDADVQGQALWFTDSDADGHGNPAKAMTACEQPAGAAASSDDCDDGDPSVFLGASEPCDGIDQDCDGIVDDACTTAPLGELGMIDAQVTITGACVDSNLGMDISMADVNDDGLLDLLAGVWCDDAGYIVQVAGSFPTTYTPNLETDSLLRVPSDMGEYLDGFETPDLNLDGLHEILTVFNDATMSTRLFRSPVLGMSPDDADLTVNWEGPGHDLVGNIVDLKVAAIPGTTGALVISACWRVVDAYAAGIWVADASVMGDFTTNDLPSLGPEGWSGTWGAAPQPDDAGDLDGDGDHELFMQSVHGLDIFTGPITASMGERSPDCNVAPGDSDGMLGTFGSTADLDGDGLDEVLLRTIWPPSEPESVSAIVGIRADGKGDFALDDVPFLLGHDLDGQAGYKIAPLDANGDDILDLAVSAVSDDTVSQDAGLVYLEYGPFEGSRELGEKGSATILGNEGGLNLGYSLAAGDTNGDGFDDLAVGTGNREGDAGWIRVFLGGP